MAGCSPAFKKDGTVTAANASGLNDGAAALVLMTARQAAKEGRQRARPHQVVGIGRRRPVGHGHRPGPGFPQGAEEGRLDDRRPRPDRGQRGVRGAGLRVGKELGWDADKVNVNGGAIAIGHPIGASGARVLTTLIYEMQKRDAKKGLATLCIGGGMGIAMCIERD